MENISQRLAPCKNQYSMVVRLLLENYSNGVTMLIAMQDHFHKFQSRLGEVEKLHPKLQVRRLNMTTTNRFGHFCTFKNYKSLAPKPYLIHLANLLNREGLK